MSATRRTLSLLAPLCAPFACGPSTTVVAPVGSDAAADVALDETRDVAVDATAPDSSGTVDTPDDAGEALDAPWSKRLGGSGAERPFGLGVNAYGDVFVGMMTSSPSIDLGTGALACSGSCIALAGLDRAGAPLWSYVLAQDASANATAMSVDGTSSLYLGGELLATATLGGPPLVAPACTNALHPDAFVARFDGDGFYLWARRFGDCDVQTVSAVTGWGTAVFVAGTFQSTIDLGLGPLTSVGARDLFVAELDGGGSTIWRRSFGVAGSTSTENVVRSIANDESGGVIVTGSFTGQIDLGGGVLTSAGGADVFVARFDVDGLPLWSKRFGDAGDQRGLDVALDPAGRVVLTGTTDGAIDLGGGPRVGAGVFVATLAADGGHVWSNVFASEGARTTRLRLDRAGQILLVGELTRAIDLGGGVVGGGAGRRSMFVAALDSAGAHAWSHGIVASTGNVWGVSVDVAPRGAPVVLAGFDGTLDFGSTFGGATYTALGEQDVFLGKLAP